MIARQQSTHTRVPVTAAEAGAAAAGPAVWVGPHAAIACLAAIRIIVGWTIVSLLLLLLLLFLRAAAPGETAAVGI